MKRINKFTAALLALSVLSPTTAGAAQPTGLVHVSQWAYNEVSAFTNAGLIPEAMVDVTEYHDNATRLQFAELVFSVIHKTRSIETEDTDFLEDTDSAAVQTLMSLNIINGTRKYIPEVIHTDMTTGEQYTEPEQKALFSPNETITRQDAATILHRALKSFTVNGSQINFAGGVPDTQLFADDAQIADYARDSVYALAARQIISGADDNKFLPLENVTIEQAISLCYRLYTQLIYSPSDGQAVYNDGEAVIQTYENGLTEIKKHNTLYIKSGDETVMEFDADVYTRILSSGNYIAAQNFNKRTEVYDISSKEKLFEIPLPVYALNDDYIYTQSEPTGSTLYGLYDYSGNEILPAEYSTAELDAIIANGMNIPDARSQSYGKIYYIGDKDGKVYSVDTNGENKTVISSQDCSRYGNYNLCYYNGSLYYETHNDGADAIMYRNDETGKNERVVASDKNNMLFLLLNDYSFLNGTSKYLYEPPEDASCGAPAHNGTGIYFTKLDLRDGLGYKLLVTDQDGGAAEITKELTDSGSIVRKICAAGTDADERAQITLTVNEPSVGKTRGYILENDKPVLVTGEYDIIGLYPAADRERVCFAVSNGDQTEIYTAKTDGSDVKLEDTMPAKKELRESTEDDQGKMIKRENVSDDEYTIYTMYDGDVWHLYSESNEGRRELFVNPDYGWVTLRRLGNTLYCESYRYVYLLGTSSDLRAFDLATGETTMLREGSHVLEIFEKENFMVFRDGNGSIWRHVPGSSETEQIYPNKGVLAGGKPIYFDKIYDQMHVGKMTYYEFIYTLDEAGNITFVSDDASAFPALTYVPNGMKYGLRSGKV